MAQASPRTRSVPKSIAVWLLAGLIVLGVVFLVGATSPDAQMYISLSLVTLGVGAVLIRHAVDRDGSISARFLLFALAAHLVGALLRFAIIQSVYHGVADAQGYVGAGITYGPMFRSFNPPPLPLPGTAFMDWFSGLIFAFIGPSMIGGFVVCATMSFVGAWYFYKAFRLAFPEGNSKLFALLIFLLPSMWYWPSSLGKDAVVMFFMGIATYGFALILRLKVVRGFLAAGIGVVGAVMVRPPMPAILVASAVAAFLVRPPRARAPQVQALVWLLLPPLMAGLLLFTVANTSHYVGDRTVVEAFEAQQSKEFGPAGGGSNFVAPNTLSPVGLPMAIITTNFRPFPWEAGGPLPILASLEGVLLVFLIVVRRHEIVRGLKSWHSNGTVVFVVAAFLGNSIALSSLTNFGLLARQRTQVLPFLFMIIAMVMPPSRATGDEAGKEPAVEPAHA